MLGRLAPLSQRYVLRTMHSGLRLMSSSKPDVTDVTRLGTPAEKPASPVDASVVSPVPATPSSVQPLNVPVEEIVIGQPAYDANLRAALNPEDIGMRAPYVAVKTYEDTTEELPSIKLPAGACVHDIIVGSGPFPHAGSMVRAPCSRASAAGCERACPGCHRLQSTLLLCSWIH
jgi:hypothetical protein